MKRINWNWIGASFVLILGSLIAGVSHWFAKVEQEFSFTILGFMSAIFSGMYYGLNVPEVKKK